MSNSKKPMAPAEAPSRHLARQARSERIGEAIVVLGLAGLLAACASGWF